MRTLTGPEALAYAARTEAPLHKYADPVEGEREVRLDEARELARLDPGLVWCRSYDWSVSDDCGGRWPIPVAALTAKDALDAAERDVRRAGREGYRGALVVRLTVSDDEGSETREVTL